MRNLQVPVRLIMPAAAMGILIVVLAVVLARVNRADDAGPIPRPNVLLIIVDDLNTDIGCMDGGAHTPNIDALARRGVLFTNAHCNAPVCNPSRVSFLTGMLPPNAGVRDNATYFREVAGGADAITLPQHFKAHGYTTAGAGKVFHAKWHNPTHPLAKLLDIPKSWDEYAQHPVGTPLPEPRPTIWQPGELGQREAKTFWWAQSPATNEETGDFQNARFAADFLRREHDKPFFLACGILRPHLPFVAPQPYFKNYPIESIDWPKAVRADDADDLPVEGRKFARRSGIGLLMKKNDRWKQAIQAYRASTEFADDAVGVVLEALDKSPHRDNTIVIFISDHGFHLGSKDHWTKFTFWDRTTRVPMIISAPGVPPGVSASTVSLVDLFPTINDLCGLPQLKNHDGHSLKPLLENPQAPTDSVARVFHTDSDHEAIIDRSFRYIRYANGDEELYDRQADPHDWHNLADQTEYADKLAGYRAKRFFTDSAVSLRTTGGSGGQ